MSKSACYNCLKITETLGCFWHGLGVQLCKQCIKELS